MNNVQLTLDDIWVSDKIPLKCITSSTKNEVQVTPLVQSPSLSIIELKEAADEASVTVGRNGELEAGVGFKVGDELEDGVGFTVDDELEDGVVLEGGAAVGRDVVSEAGVVVGYDDELEDDATAEHAVALEAGDELERGVVLETGVAVGCVDELEDGIVLGGGIEVEHEIEITQEIERENEDQDEEVEVVYKQSHNTSSSFTHDHNYNAPTVVKGGVQKKPTSTRSKHRTKYLSSWEKKDEAQYKTYIFDDYGGKHEKFLCWLYYKDGSMHCRLCEKYGKVRNSNGKANMWCNMGMNTLSLDKIKLHKEDSDAHKQAEEQELVVSCRAQPDWYTTKNKQFSKHEQSIQNLMLTCIYICQQDNSLNTIEPLCSLLEKLGVTLLPAEISGVSYRNDTAALCFIQHIAHYLHKELVDKIKQSPVIGWMLDETTSRSVEKSCIVYIRYIDNFEPKTAYYALLDLEGDGTAANIVQALSSLWKTDELNPISSCWLATDNASTFTGVREGVIAKLQRQLSADWLDINGCVAHSFALVGSQASYLPKTPDNKTPVQCHSIEKLESTISHIHSYFGRSTNNQFKLKSWQAFMEIPELKFKRIFDIRWLSLRGCIKPIIDNVQPGSQALLACLEYNMLDINSSKADRTKSKELLDSVLDDEFLFLLHMHHDLHETVLGPLTKTLQHDHLSYFHLMEVIAQKRKILTSWSSESTSVMGPALSDYIESTESGSFGGFQIKTGDRGQFLVDGRKYIQRLVQELDKRFKPSMVQESLSTLFDPQHLIKNKKKLDSIDYGRAHLDFLRRKYKNFPGLDCSVVRNEWEAFKHILIDFLQSFSSNCPEKLFWKNFVALKQSTNNFFIEEYKNIFVLLNIYLISPTNSAECERGFSAVNRIQTVGRSRLMISTLNVLMTVRMLMKDDLRRCQQVVEKAFELWNDKDYNRRLHEIQVLADVTDNYQPVKQVRSVAKRRLSFIQSELMNKKPKRPKSNSIKCANGCKTSICEADPAQQEAIQCCHQSDQFDWIDFEDNCSRWLCNGCRIKLKITTDSIWFCADHCDMHIDDDENDNIE